MSSRSVTIAASQMLAMTVNSEFSNLVDNQDLWNEISTDQHLTDLPFQKSFDELTYEEFLDLRLEMIVWLSRVVKEAAENETIKLCWGAEEYEWFSDASGICKIVTLPGYTVVYFTTSRHATAAYNDLGNYEFPGYHKVFVEDRKIVIS